MLLHVTQWKNLGLSRDKQSNRWSDRKLYDQELLKNYCNKL